MTEQDDLFALPPMRTHAAHLLDLASACAKPEKRWISCL